MEARRDVGFGGGPGFGFRGPRRGGDDGDRGGRRRDFGPQPSPEAEALQKAIESKASNEELKAKLAKFREARKAKEATLAKVQEDLRKVLTVRQEAAAVTMGLLQ
jgi:Spy/CpxP family protein refolding chaperone